VLLTLADFFGRKKIIIAAGCLILMGMSCLNFAPGIYLKMVGMGLTIGCEGTFSGIFSILINETTCKYFHISFVFI
jgi:hypothetical protein